MPKSPTDKRHFIIVAALVAISTVVLNFVLEHMLPLPVEASTEARTVDQLIGWHLTMIAFLFSLIVVFMLYCIVVFRKRDGDESEGQHFEGNTTLEIVWTVVPLIMVIVFTFIGINALTKVTHAEPNELVIKVTAMQWAWSFQYPNGAVSTDLVLPVNQRARMEMNSKDVIHSFWIPEMRVKQDVVPGMTTMIRFNPIRIGDYKVRCAELCGSTTTICERLCASCQKMITING